MKAVFTTTEGSGHVGPLLPVADAAARLGADVLLVVPPPLAERAAGSGHAVEVCDAVPPAELSRIWARVREAPAAEAAVLVNRDIFGRLDTAAMLPTLERVCDRWGADVLLHEAAEFAAPVAAVRRGLPHVQVAIGLAEVEWRSLDIAAPALVEVEPSVVEAIRRSPYVTRLPASVDPSRYGATRRYRQTGDTHAVASAPPAAGTRPRVFVSFGTVVGSSPTGAAAFRAALGALGDLDVDALVTLGRSLDLDAAVAVPPNVRVESWVSQPEALAHSDLVVCHGGAGTTFDALAAGLPLVVVPVMADQPANGRLVAAAGAGVVVAPDLDDPAGFRRRLTDAIQRVLDDEGYRAAAGRLGDEVQELPSIDDVVGQVLGQAGTRDRL